VDPENENGLKTPTSSQINVIFLAHAGTLSGSYIISKSISLYLLFNKCFTTVM